MEDRMVCPICGEAIEKGSWTDIYRLDGERDCYRISEEVPFDDISETFDLDTIYEMIAEKLEVPVSEIVLYSFEPWEFTERDFRMTETTPEKIGAACLSCNGSL